MLERDTSVTLASCLVLGLSVLGASAPVLAQTTTPDSDLPPGVTREGPVTLELSDRYRFESETLGEAFLVDVVRIESPLASSEPDRELPILFVTDNTAFSSLVPAIVRMDSLEGLPPMLVVGIGYAFASSMSLRDEFFEFNVRRSHDFTPTVDEAWVQELTTFSQAQFGKSWSGTPGGADAFLAFINDELKPFVAAHYPADLDDTAIFGHSLGGLFVLHVFFTSPESFDRYIAISPAAQYDDGLLFREEAKLGDVAARLFMAVGGQDQPPILESVPRLDARIRASARSNLSYTYRLFPGETHSSVIPGALMRGLRSVFDPPPPFPPPRAPAQE
jgi:predicted alpha/beta superfamily hydrolase